MKLLLTTLAIVYLSLFMSLQAQEQVRVIPYPAEVTMQAETCKLKSGQKIHYLDASLYKEAAFLEKKLADLNYKMKVVFYPTSCSFNHFLNASISGFQK